MGTKPLYSAPAPSSLNIVTKLREANDQMEKVGDGTEQHTQGKSSCTLVSRQQPWFRLVYAISRPISRLIRILSA